MAFEHRRTAVTLAPGQVDTDRILDRQLEEHRDWELVSVVRTVGYCDVATLHFFWKRLKA